MALCDHGRLAFRIVVLHREGLLAQFTSCLRVAEQRASPSDGVQRHRLVDAMTKLGVDAPGLHVVPQGFGLVWVFCTVR